MPDEALTSPAIHRAENRKDTNWIGLVRLFDGTEIPCTVRDVSVSGAKLGIPESYALPDDFMLRVLGHDFVCRVRLAWRRGNFVGVRIERVGKLAAAPAPKPADGAPQAGEPDGGAIRARRSRFSAY